MYNTWVSTLPLSETFRVQAIHIISEAIGTEYSAYQNYQFIHDTLSKEYGVFNLSKNKHFSIDKQLFDFLLNEIDINKVLDVIELSFRFIDLVIRKNIKQDYFYKRNHSIAIDADEAIADLNTRFKEHGVGYQFESSEIIRVDSEFIHSEVVKPTLLILRGEQYAGANEEFLNAHEHYRHGKYKECLNDCLKAFESTMRTICNRRGWEVPSNANASKLITTCFTNKLLPHSFDSQMNSVKSLLDVDDQINAVIKSLFESGVPTVRNKLSGHEQGETPVVVPEHLARYALHLTATTILLLAEADANKN